MCVLWNLPRIFKWFTLTLQWGNTGEGGREGERDSERRRGEGSWKGQRNWLRGEKYSLEQWVPWNCILRWWLCMCGQDRTYKRQKKDRVNNRQVKHAVPQVDFHTLLQRQLRSVCWSHRSTMSVLIATQLKIDTSTSSGKVRPCTYSINFRHSKNHCACKTAWCFWYYKKKC